MLGADVRRYAGGDGANCPYAARYAASRIFFRPRLDQPKFTAVKKHSSRHAARTQIFTFCLGENYAEYPLRGAILVISSEPRTEARPSVRFFMGLIRSGAWVRKVE
jgi:hypothetical protein